MLKTHEVKRYLSLSSLFAIAFVVPIYIGIYFFGEVPLTPTLDADPVFPESLPVKSRGAFFSVSSTAGFAPSEGKDFLFFAWFKLEVLPENDQEMSLFSKIDYSQPYKPGFALTISRKLSLIQPSIYWRNAQGKGSTFRFSDLPVSLGDWYAFVVSYKQPNILGLHVVRIGEGEKPTTNLLGAYLLKVPVYPVNEIPLTVGAPQLGSFRGSIGPVGIVNGPDATGELKNILKMLAKNPLSINKVLDKKSTVFLTTNGVIDRGPLQLPIHLSTKVG